MDPSAWVHQSTRPSRTQTHNVPIFAELRESKDRTKELIGHLREAHGEDGYRLRSQIASRLRSLVLVLHVAPAGHAPLLQSSIEWLQADHGDGAADVVAHMREMASSEHEQRRYFLVGFKDGGMRAVYPTKDNPLEFEEQLVSSDGTSLLRQTPDRKSGILLATQKPGESGD